MSNLKVFQNTDLRIYSNFTFYPLDGKRENYVSRGRNIELLYRSIRHVKSLKRTLYSLPKTILIYPYTPLHNVNVTSISTTQELTTLIFFILDKFIF